MRVDGQIYGERITTGTTSSTSGIGGFFQQFMPPSPTDVMNKVLIGVAIVSGVGLIIAVIFIVSRKRKGKYE